jgi:hypothetical protein
MIGVSLKGGLGNQLFQLAAIETIADETNRKVCIVEKDTPKTVHSQSNYYSSIFSKLLHYPILPNPYLTIQELSSKKQDWNKLLPETENVCLDGYFQDWRYIQPNFIEKLTLPECPIINGAFIHIRGGDYVNHWLHHVDLTAYYEKAIKYFSHDTNFYIFTNDIDYAKSFTFLSTITYSFVIEEEVMALTMMSKCTKGGICANSTFSWWGGFLNQNRTIIIPSKWSNDSNIVQEEGYFFEGTTRII